MKPVLVLALAATLALPAFAHAQNPPAGGYAPAPDPAPGVSPPPRPRGAGRGVTLALYQQRFRDRIMRADTDHDGRVSLAEWEAGAAQRSGAAGGAGRGDPARMFQRMDLNHDGYLTADEIDAVSARRFARLDANHDGVLTPDERMAGRGGPGGGGRGMGPDDESAPVEPLGPR